jgi:hypothetical protein
VTGRNPRNIECANSADTILLAALMDRGTDRDEGISGTNGRTRGPVPSFLTVSLVSKLAMMSFIRLRNFHRSDQPVV